MCIDCNKALSILHEYEAALNDSPLSGPTREQNQRVKRAALEIPKLSEMQCTSKDRPLIYGKFKSSLERIGRRIDQINEHGKFSRLFGLRGHQTQHYVHCAKRRIEETIQDLKNKMDLDAKVAQFKRDATYHENPRVLVEQARKLGHEREAIFKDPHNFLGDKILREVREVPAYSSPLITYVVSKIDPEEVYQAKVIAHLYDVANVNGKNYEGLHPLQANWFGMFANSLEAHSGKAELIQALKSAEAHLENPDFEAMAQDINQGKLVILPFGHSGHATSLIFHEGLLIECDGNARQPFKAHSVDCKKITAYDLENFYIAQTLYNEPEMRSLLHTFLLEKRIPSTPRQMEMAVALKNQKGQTLGNCSCFAAKGAFRAASLLLGESGESFLEQFQAEKLSEYKHREIRDESLLQQLY